MKRQILALAALAAVLLFGAYFVHRASNEKEQGVAQRNLFDLPENGIVSVEIANFTQGYSFEKKGADWFVTQMKTELAKSIEADNAVKDAKTSAEKAETAKESDQPVKADPVKLTSLLTSLQTLKIGEPVATEKDSVGKFQINQHSMRVTLYGEGRKELGRLYVGKIGPNFMSTYVKKNDADAVYLVEENLQGLLNYSYEQWALSEQGADAQQPLKKDDKTASAQPGKKKGNAHAATKSKKPR